MEKRYGEQKEMTKTSRALVLSRASTYDGARQASLISMAKATWWSLQPRRGP